jgi:hypothetical protein
MFHADKEMVVIDLCKVEIFSRPSCVAVKIVTYYISYASPRAITLFHKLITRSATNLL